MEKNINIMAQHLNFTEKKRHHFRPVAVAGCRQSEELRGESSLRETRVAREARVIGLCVRGPKESGKLLGALSAPIAKKNREIPGN